MQLFLDSAVKADCADDVRLILKRAARHGVAPAARVGYATSAQQFVQ
jgi:hypothetical protein